MSQPPERAAGLSAAEFGQVAALLYDWTGMTFGQNKHYYLERRVLGLMQDAGIADLRSYLSLLLPGSAERQRLINACTINETYFYREDYQLAALSNELLPRLIQTRRPGDRIRIWSLPCSTGEEAYSIAIWLLENWPLVDAYNIDIVGSDIDTVALEQAKTARYGSRSVARLPAALVERYFEHEEGGAYQLIDDLRESVRFSAANITDRGSMRAQGRFDVVLCRNLLIYFDQASRVQAADNLFDAINPGGFLCLGHSESMMRIDERFTLTRAKDAIVYQKP